MTYLDYFELTTEPFSNAPVSRFYYNSAQHSQALTRLMHATSFMKGLSILVGDIGAGKTTLARRMLDSLPESEYEAALLELRAGRHAATLDPVAARDLDRSAAQIRAAMARNPGARFLLDRLRSTCAQRLALAQRSIAT